MSKSIHYYPARILAPCAGVAGVFLAMAIFAGLPRAVSAAMTFSIGGLELRAVNTDERFDLVPAGDTVRLRWSATNMEEIARYRMRMELQGAGGSWQDLDVPAGSTIADITIPSRAGLYRMQLLACDLPTGADANEPNRCPEDHFYISSLIFRAVDAIAPSPEAIGVLQFSLTPAIIHRGDTVTLSWSAPRAAQTFFVRDWNRDGAEAEFALRPAAGGTVQFADTNSAALWPVGEHRFRVLVCTASRQCTLAPNWFEYAVQDGAGAGSGTSSGGGASVPNGSTAGNGTTVSGAVPLALIRNLRVTLGGVTETTDVMPPGSEIALRWNVNNPDDIVRYRLFGRDGNSKWENLDIGRREEALTLTAPNRAGTYALALLACNSPIGTDRTDRNRCPEGNFDMETIALRVGEGTPGFGMSNLFVLRRGGDTVAQEVPAGSEITYRWDAVGEIARYRLNVSSGRLGEWQDIIVPQGQKFFDGRAPSNQGIYHVQLLACDTGAGEPPRDPNDPRRCLPGHFRIIETTVRVTSPQMSLERLRTKDFSASIFNILTPRNSKYKSLR